MMTPNTTTSAPENILRKIQKLLNLTQSSNEAEASLAQARANEMLIKWNLDAAMVKDTYVEGGVRNGEASRPEEKREKTRVNRTAKYKWQQELWSVLAETNFCWHWVARVYEGKRGTKSTTSKVPVKRHMILGKESNVMSVRMMGEYLEDTIERILPYPNQERMSRSALSWKAGCAERLAERIRERFSEMQKSQQQTTSGQTMAIALRDVMQAEYEANYDARYGAGSYKRKLLWDVEWEKVQAECEQKAAEDAAKAEKEWLEYLANETPEQKKKREQEEAKERIREAKRSARLSNSYWRERDQEAAKVDDEAYWAGKQAGAKISLASQVSDGRVTRKDRMVE